MAAASRALQRSPCCAGTRSSSRCGVMKSGALVDDAGRPARTNVTSRRCRSKSTSRRARRRNRPKAMTGRARRRQAGLPPHGACARALGPHGSTLSGASRCWSTQLPTTNAESRLDGQAVAATGRRGDGPDLPAGGVDGADVALAARRSRTQAARDRAARRRVCRRRGQAEQDEGQHRRAMSCTPADGPPYAQGRPKRQSRLVEARPLAQHVQLGRPASPASSAGRASGRGRRPGRSPCGRCSSSP